MFQCKVGCGLQDEMLQAANRKLGESGAGRCRHEMDLTHQDLTILY